MDANERKILEDAGVLYPTVVSNADRIRSMSDEELAQFIKDMEVQGYDLHGTFGAEYWLDRLKQEYKE